MSSLAPLLRLPLELRYEIYSHLCLAKSIAYPFGFGPITCIDLVPPPTSFQLACRRIHYEIQTYFYDRVILRFLATTVVVQFNSCPSAPALQAIRRAKKVEVYLVWNITTELAARCMTTWPKMMYGWLEVVSSLLQREGKKLESVVVTVTCASDVGVGWEMKKQLLAPLSNLLPGVKFVLGEVEAEDEVKAGLRRQLREHVNELNAMSV